MTLSHYRVVGSSSEKGSTLLVSLVFLIIFTLFAFSVFKGSVSSSLSLNNMQWRDEAISAANDSIDKLLSDKTILNDPAADALKTFSVDITGDGNGDVQVTWPAVIKDGVAKAGPRCVRVEPIPAGSLNPAVAEDLACLSSPGSGSEGLSVATASGSSSNIALSIPLCSNTEWSLTVRATDQVTNSSVDVTQGVGRRVLTTSVSVCE